MSATLKTENLKLPYYAQSDYTTWEDYNEAMNLIDAAVGKNDTDLSTLTENVQNNTNALQTLNSTVSGLNNTSAGNSSSITALQSRMTKAEADITANASSVTSLMNDYEKLSASISGLPDNLSAEITALQTKNASQDTAIATAQSEADTATQTAQNANTAAVEAKSLAQSASADAQSAMTAAQNALSVQPFTQITNAQITQGITVVSGQTLLFNVKNAAVYTKGQCSFFTGEINGTLTDNTKPLTAQQGAFLFSFAPDGAVVNSAFVQSCNVIVALSGTDSTDIRVLPGIASTGEHSVDITADFSGLPNSAQVIYGFSIVF